MPEPRVEPPPLIEAVAALFAWDARPARERLVTALAAPHADAEPPLTSVQMRELRVAVDAVLAAADSWDVAAERHAREHLSRAIRVALGRPDALPLLLLYVRHACEQLWELTWNHRPMLEVIQIVDEAMESLPRAAVDRDSEVAWRLLQFLRHEFLVESAMLTGAISVVRATATQARAAIADVRLADGRRGRRWLARAEVSEEIRKEETYFACVQSAADGAWGFLHHDVASLDTAMTMMRDALRSGALEAEDASEIRSHLAALEALESARNDRWLHVDHGQVVVIYPFSLRSTRADATDRLVADAIAGATEWELAGLRVTEAPKNALAVSDAWQGDDALGRHFGGAELVLPDLELRRTVGDEVVVRTVGVKVQISALGNHVVRFDIGVADAGPGDLAEIVSMASPVYSDLHELAGLVALNASTDAQGAPTRYANLASVARQIIADVHDGLREHVGHDSKVTARRGLYSVVSVVDQARVMDGAEDRVGGPLIHARDLVDLGGAQPLLHPMRGGATSVCDWASYDRDEVDVRTLLTLNGEILTANANTTMLASFASPAYSVNTVRSYVEFAYSLQGMYAGWNDEVALHAQETAARLDQVDEFLRQDPRSMDEAAAEALQDSLADIERAELTLQRFLQSTQATMLFIESPSLVTSASLRIDLDTVLAASRYQALRDSFEMAKNEVLGHRLQELLDIVSRRVTGRIEQERARQTEKSRRLLDAVLVGIGVIGISGLLSMLQAGFALGELPTMAMVVALATLALVFIAVSWRNSGTRRRRPSRDGKDSP